MGRPALGLSPQIGQLKNHHRSMARDIIAAGELRNKDLARIYCMNETQISIIVNSPVFIAELARLETEVEENICEVREDIRLMTPRAAQVLREELYREDNEELGIKLNHADRKLRLGVAQDILDRDGGKKKQGESASKSLHFHSHKEVHLVKKMSDEELEKDIFDLISEDV